MLGKMMINKKKKLAITQGQMSGYFQGHDDVHTKSDEWGVANPDQMGFFDFDQIIKDAEKAVDDWSKDILPESVKKNIDAEIKKSGEKLTAEATKKATQAAQNLLQKKASDPKVQDKAIASGIQAGAKAVEQASLDAAQAWREGGIKGVYEKFPIPFYVAGGLVGLMTLKWTLGQIGAGRAKAIVKQAQNPKKRRKTKRK